MFCKEKFAIWQLCNNKKVQSQARALVKSANIKCIRCVRARAHNYRAFFRNKKLCKNGGKMLIIRRFA